MGLAVLWIFSRVVGFGVCVFLAFGSVGFRSLGFTGAGVPRDATGFGVYGLGLELCLGFIREG